MGELVKRSEGDRSKLKLAAKLRAESAGTLKWIAVRVQMGTVASLTNVLLAERQEGRVVNMRD